jgi:recombination protein RecR
MIDKMPHLVKLVRQLQQVPYLASKNVYKVVQYLLDMNPAKAEQLCSIILDAKEHIQKCQTCWVWKEKSQDCSFCSHPQRDKSVICVVQTWQDIIAIERTSGFQGVYHVLGGLLSPLEGVGPEDLTISHLINRSINTDVKELIFAFNQTPEGEATSSYIAQRLKDYNVSISCIARGLPVGSSLESMDRVTVFKALSERRPF